MTKPVLQYIIKHSVADAEALVRAALQEEGFGILTEVDLSAVMRQRLGVELPPHKLLGACNPRIAHASIQAEPDVAAFLPCGISLREGADPSETIVTVQDPFTVSGAFQVDGLEGPGREARSRIESALAKIGSEG